MLLAAEVSPRSNLLDTHVHINIQIICLDGHILRARIPTPIRSPKTPFPLPLRKPHRCKSSICAQDIIHVRVPRRSCYDMGLIQRYELQICRHSVRGRPSAHVPCDCGGGSGKNTRAGNAGRQDRD